MLSTLRQKNYDNNIAVMDLVGPKYHWTDVNKSCMLIKEYGNLKVDFYPHTGKWKHTVNHRQKVHNGDAGSFIK